MLQELLQDEEAKQIVAVVSLPTAIGYAHWVAPGVPTERLQALRAAYAATLNDPAFLEEAKKLSMLVRPLSGEELVDLVKRAAATPKPVLDKTAKLLNWGS
jgi:tripartite-type tricarboxylate transporter receptor subunit TctC